MKNHTENLKESEGKLKLILENANDLISILNNKYIYEYINEKPHQRILGYSKNELIGNSPWKLIYPEDFNKYSKPMKKREELNKSTIEFKVKHKKGHWIWIQSKGRVFLDANNKKKILLVSRDITKHKIIEQQLQDSEKKYRKLFESSTDGMYSTNMEGNFIEANNAFLNMLGYSKEEILIQNFRRITPKKWYEIEDNILFTELSAGESKVYEKEFFRKNGTTLAVNVRIWILQDEQGDPNRIWAIVRDITESKKIEQELLEINQLKSDFLKRASHELKTPLSAIKGFSGLILSLYSDSLNRDVISKLEEIDKGCERLKNIINNLLHTSRLESPELKPKLKRENLSFLIKCCVDELFPLIAKRQHSIKIDIDNFIETKFEKEEIRDVISNLLTNAIKYTPPKGKIGVKTKIIDSFIVVSIKDNGIGFTEDEKDMIFQQFGKIERYGQGLDLEIDGTGLGLYI